jgi:hypothetical protein
MPTVAYTLQKKVQHSLDQDVYVQLTFVENSPGAHSNQIIATYKPADPGFAAASAVAVGAAATFTY